MGRSLLRRISLFISGCAAQFSPRKWKLRVLTAGLLGKSTGDSSRKVSFAPPKDRGLTELQLRGQDFPSGPVVKNLPANEGDTVSIPSLGRSHMSQSR